MNIGDKSNFKPYLHHIFYIYMIHGFSFRLQLTDVYMYVFITISIQ